MLFSTTDTSTRVPRMQALPWQTFGLTVMRSRQCSMLAFYTIPHARAARWGSVLKLSGRSIEAPSGRRLLPSSLARRTQPKLLGMRAEFPHLVEIHAAP